MKLVRYIRIAALVAIVSVPAVASAAGLVPVVPPTCNGPDCTICDFAQLAQNILNDAIYLAVVLSALLFAWAGWNHMTAGSNTGKIKKANSVFTNVFIGLIIILTAWLVVDTLMKTITGGNLGPWNQVCNQ